MGEEVEADIKRIQESKCWVVEGVFGHLVDNFLSFADILIHLDLPWEECEKNLLFEAQKAQSNWIIKKLRKIFKHFLNGLQNTTHGIAKHRKTITVRFLTVFQEKNIGFAIVMKLISC